MNKGREKGSGDGRVSGGGREDWGGEGDREGRSIVNKRRMKSTQQNNVAVGERKLMPFSCLWA